MFVQICYMYMVSGLERAFPCNSLQQSPCQAFSNQVHCTYMKQSMLKGKKKQCMLACVYRVMDACGKFEEHERGVRVAQGNSQEQL